MHRHATSPGIDDEALLQNAQRYDRFKEDRAADGLPIPVGEGVLIWDEVKVIFSNTSYNLNTQLCLHGMIVVKYGM